MPNAHIIGTGLSAPGPPVPNDYFTAKFGPETDAFLKAKRNIFSRHFIQDEQTTSDLAVQAADEALQMAQLTAQDLDLIIVATDTPDYLSPSTAVIVQNKLGANKAGAFDLNSACAGFVTALDTANKYIRSDPDYKYILVIGAYAMSRFVNPDERNLVTLFADGAGAVILKSSEAEGGILASQLFADGQYNLCTGLYAGGAKNPISRAVIEKELHYLDMSKGIPASFNTDVWPNMIRETALKAGIDVDKIAHYIFTQINIGSILGTLDLLNAPHDKAVTVMEKYAYTGSACVPMALDDAVRSHKINAGDYIMMIGSGGGVSVASLILQWTI